MASKHEHDWDVYTDFEDRIRVRCDCGADEDWSILKQQLAQARALLERAAFILSHAFGGGDLTEEIRAFLAQQEPTP